MSKKTSTTLPILLITIGLLFFVFVILVLGIQTMHMRGDENLTFSNMDYDFVTSMEILFTLNNQAPLWWMNTWVWQQLVGKTEWVNRINSILFSMLTVSLLFQIAKQWFGKPRYGWGAMAILGVNAFFFIYSLEMRMYALVMLTATLSMYLYARWLTRPSLRRAIAYGLSATLMLYVHYYLAFVVIVQIIFFLAYSAFQVVKKSSQNLPPLWIQGILAGVVALVAWLPGIVILIQQLQFIEFVENDGLTITTFPTDADNVSYLINVTTNGWPLIYAILILVGVWVVRRRIGLWVAVAWGVLAPTLVLVLNLVLTIYTPRYVSFAAPAIGLLVGVALVMGTETIFSTFGKRFKRFLITALVSLVALASLWQLPQYIPNRVPYRFIYWNMEAITQPDDVIYYRGVPPSVDRQEDLYFDFDLQRVGSADEAAQHRRVWYVSRDFWKDRIRQPFEQLQETHRLWHVEGDCNTDWCFLAQLLVAPPSDAPVMFGGEVGFLGADIEPLPDENRLQAWLWWEVPATPTQDYAISLQLLDAEGRLVAQQDRQIQSSADDPFVPTSQLQPDQVYLDWRALDLPADWDTGTYALQLIVYQWQDQTRLTLPDGNDALSLSLSEHKG